MRAVAVPATLAQDAGAGDKIKPVVRQADFLAMVARLEGSEQSIDMEVVRRRHRGPACPTGKGAQL